VSRPGVQAGKFVLREAALPAGATPAIGEKQRMVFANLDWTTAGSTVGFSFSFEAIGRRFESDAIYLYDGSLVAKSAATVAGEIRTNLFNLLRRIEPGLTDISSITVTPVASGLQANEYAFDIEFGGQLLGHDIEQVSVNTASLKSANRAPTDPAYRNLSLAGFSPGGQDLQRSTATTFSTLNDLMARFQQAVNDHLDVVRSRSTRASTSPRPASSST
jgi:hypothetical protein